MDTWLPVLGFTAFFVFLHVLTLSRFEPVYPRAFKLSRAGAAAILTALGTGALIGGFEHWSEAFLYRQSKDDWMRTGLLVVYGHLLADFIWMWVGARYHGIKPRKDLMIHHGLGVIGFGAALVLEIGYAFGLLTMITELLPLTTGVNAWGKRVAMPRIVTAADRARLYVLAFLRIPLWSALFVLVAIALFADGGSAVADGLQPAYWFAAIGLMGLLSLDVFWIGKCRQNVDFY